MNLTSLSRMVLLSGITVFGSNSIYANLLSSQELESITKEDIATAQALLHICPALVHDMTYIQHNVDQFTQENLTRFSTPMTLQQLQSDSAYKTALALAQQEQMEYSKEEQQLGCEELDSPSTP